MKYGITIQKMTEFSRLVGYVSISVDISRSNEVYIYDEVNSFKFVPFGDLTKELNRRISLAEAKDDK
uniref:Uncharacterized protein n=1 Tax=viral metagenome TaxID=1070528 RepID=A0A6M3LQ26_9ZZZZ